MLNSIVAVMCIRLHIHKLCGPISRRALVSETTNIISCDASTPPSCDFRYLGRMEFETGSG